MLASVPHLLFTKYFNYFLFLVIQDFCFRSIKFKTTLKRRKLVFPPQIDPYGKFKSIPSQTNGYSNIVIFIDNFFLLFRINYLEWKHVEKLSISKAPGFGLLVSESAFCAMIDTNIVPQVDCHKQCLSAQIKETIRSLNEQKMNLNPVDGK